MRKVVPADMPLTMRASQGQHAAARIALQKALA